MRKHIVVDLEGFERFKSLKESSIPISTSLLFKLMVEFAIQNKKSFIKFIADENIKKLYRDNKIEEDTVDTKDYLKPEVEERTTKLNVVGKEKEIELVNQEKSSANSSVQEEVKDFPRKGFIKF